MKTRTAAFDREWADRRSRIADYYIKVQRNYWNGSAFVWETGSTIPKRQIKRIGAITQKFDIPLELGIKASNVQIELDNRDYQWLPSNTTDGRWIADATATIGYEPVFSKFTIYYGYKLADGTTEYLAQFVGVISPTDDPKFDPKAGTATFSLTGLAEALLSGTDAQRVSTTLTDQATSPATGDGANKSFSVNVPAVWSIDKVKDNGVVQTQSQTAGWSESQANDPVLDALIGFTTAPINTHTILWTGRQWYQNQKIGALVGLICDAAGITAANRQIQEVVFPNGVNATFTIDSEANFEAGTLTNIDSTTIPGSIQTQWISMAGVSQFVGTISTWSFDMAFSKADGNGTTPAKFVVSNDPYGNGYQCSYYTDAGGTIDIRESGTVLGSFSGVGTGAATLRFTRASDGTMKLYYNGVLKVTVSSTTFNSFQKLFSVPLTATITSIYLSYQVTGAALSTATPVWISAVQDVGSTPVAWGNFTATQTLNSGAILWETSSSSDNITYDAYVAVSGSVVGSALKRYIKIRATLTTYVELTPVIDKVTLVYSTSQPLISMADFSGLDGLGAVQALAEMCGYEFGTAGDGTFFFRNKTVMLTSSISLSQKNAIVAVQDYSNGFKDVRNIGQVNYGNAGTNGTYFYEYKDTDAAEAAPTTRDRFKDQPLRLDLTRFAFTNDAQVAQGIAQKLYQDNYRPKRKLTILCRSIPQIDLSDGVTIDYHDSPLVQDVIFGDPFQSSFPVDANPLDTLVRALLMKVVGHQFDPIKSQSLLYLEEVLS